MEHLEAVSDRPGETNEQTSDILTNLLVGIREGVGGSHGVDVAQNSRYFVGSVKFLQSMERESLGGGRGGSKG